MITFVKARPIDWVAIAMIAETSWPIAYGDILAQEQIDFMLDTIYSKEGIQEAMKNDQVFYFLREGKDAVGFIALQIVEDVLRIEKLYLLPEAKGKGLGSKSIEFAAEVAQRNNIATLELNVNRSNPAYHFYLKQGFSIVKSVDIPYHGFVLDDYVMRKELLWFKPIVS